MNELNELIEARHIEPSAALDAMASVYRFQLLKNPQCYPGGITAMSRINAEVRKRMTGTGYSDREAALQILGTHITSLLTQLEVHPVVALDAAMNLVVHSLQDAPELAHVAISVLKELVSNLEAGGTSRVVAAALSAVQRH